MRLESRIHTYQQFFDLNGQTYDRNQLIATHGLISPKYAAEHDIPYQKRSNVGTDTIPQAVLDDVIYIFSIKDRFPLPLPLVPYVYLKESVQTLSPDEMQKLHNGWVSFSQGEVYAFGRIPPEDLVFPE